MEKEELLLGFTGGEVEMHEPGPIFGLHVPAHHSASNIHFGIEVNFLVGVIHLVEVV